MANTYTQIHIHAVFAVQNRKCVIREEWEEELYKYIAGIIRNNDHKLLIINGVKDHVHLLFGMRPTQSLSELMQKIKHESSKWINQRGFITDRFSWQAGYGAFSYSKSQLPIIIRYIENQKQHHAKKKFTEEYVSLLEMRDIDYNDQYIFHDV